MRFHSRTSNKRESILPRTFGCGPHFALDGPFFPQAKTTRMTTVLKTSQMYAFGSAARRLLVHRAHCAAKKTRGIRRIARFACTATNACLHSVFQLQPRSCPRRVFRECTANRRLRNSPSILSTNHDQTNPLDGDSGMMKCFDGAARSAAERLSGDFSHAVSYHTSAEGWTGGVGLQ
jgi:hypothetical protein